MNNFKLNYTETSLQDIADIGSYIAEDNQDRAMSFCNELFEACEQLELFPYKGVYPKYIEYKIANIRMLPFRKYLIFYVLKEIQKQVIILRVVNSALHYKNIF